MSYTLSNLIRDAMKYQGVDAFDIRTATGGGTTQFYDTNLEDKYDEDELKDGTILVLRADGAAPEGEFSRISAYTESTNLATIGTLTAGISSGDTCMIISAEYPVRTLIELANDALRDCGEITYHDDTSLDTLATVTEYTLPTGVKNLKSVCVQNSNTTTGENEWSTVTGWKIIPGLAGAADVIVFSRPFSAGYDLMLIYDRQHPDVSAYSDYISESIQPPLIALILADKIMAWHGVTDENSNYANKILSQLEDAKRRFLIRRIKPMIKYLAPSIV